MQTAQTLKEASTVHVSLDMKGMECIAQVNPISVRAFTKYQQFIPQFQCILPETIVTFALAEFSMKLL